MRLLACLCVLCNEALLSGKPALLAWLRNTVHLQPFICVVNSENIYGMIPSKAQASVQQCDTCFANWYIYI